HRNRQLNERVDRVGGRGTRAGSEQRTDERRTVGQTGALFIHYLYLVALEHRDVHELAGFFAASILDHQQPGLDDLKHEAKSWDLMGGAPDAQFVPVAPNAKVDSGALDGGREPRKGDRGEREQPLEHQRLPRLLRRKESKRNFGKVAFLAP